MSPAIVRLVTAGMLAIGVAACTSSTEPRGEGLVGTWVAPRVQLGCTPYPCPNHSMVQELSFASSGEFRFTTRTYGAYSGQGKNDLSSYSHTTGTYSTVGEKLNVTALRLAQWDSFYGANSGVKIYEPYPYGTVFDDATYEVVGTELRLAYTTYPADAPVPTRAVYTRAAPD